MISDSKSLSLTSVGKLRESPRQRLFAWHCTSLKLPKSWRNRVTERPAGRPGLIAISFRRDERNVRPVTAASSW